MVGLVAYRLCERRIRKKKKSGGLAWTCPKIQSGQRILPRFAMQLCKGCLQYDYDSNTYGMAEYECEIAHMTRIIL